jgi:hypothetical protein
MRSMRTRAGSSGPGDVGCRGSCDQTVAAVAAIVTTAPARSARRQSPPRRSRRRPIARLASAPKPNTIATSALSDRRSGVQPQPMPSHVDPEPTYG